METCLHIPIAMFWLPDEGFLVIILQMRA